jgi:hypothetical protein
MLPGDMRALCEQCEDLLLLAMAKLCFDAHHLSPVFLDDRLSSESIAVPSYEHQHTRTCRLCSSFACDELLILIGLSLIEQDVAPVTGTCQISVCQESGAMEVRVSSLRLDTSNYLIDLHASTKRSPRKLLPSF